MPPFKSELKPGEKPHSSMEVDPPLMVPDPKEDLLELLCHDLGTKSLFQPKTIASLDEELATQLWEEVRGEKLKTKDVEENPPLSIITHTEVG